MILAGGVIEELLRLYLAHKNITPSRNTFSEYIKACQQNGLTKKGICLGIINSKKSLHIANTDLNINTTVPQM